MLLLLNLNLLYVTDAQFLFNFETDSLFVIRLLQWVKSFV